MVSVWLLCVCSLLGGITLRPAASSHFMGGLYRWRPVVPGAAYDGRVRTDLCSIYCNRIIL